MASVELDLLKRQEKGEELSAEEHDNNFSNIEQAVAELCALIDSLNVNGSSGLSALQDAVNILASELATLETELASLQSNLTGVESDVASNEGRISDNETAIATTNGQLNAFQSDLNGAVVAAQQALVIANDALDATAGVAANTSAINGNTLAIDAIDTQIIAINDSLTLINAELALINVPAINAAIAAKLGSIVMMPPNLIQAQIGAGSTALTKTLGVPSNARNAILQAETEISSDGAAANEGYTKINNTTPMARAIVGIGAESIAANTSTLWVDVSASKDIIVDQFIEVSGTHAKVPVSKTELYLIGYAL